MPFSEHANRNRDLEATEDENHGLTPPPPPPSLPAPSTPLPPPEEPREEQAQNQTLVDAAIDHSIPQSEVQGQVGEYTPDHGLVSNEAIEKDITLLVCQTEKTRQWIQRLLADKKECEMQHLEWEKKLRHYESMETDKDNQISRLKSENLELRNTLDIISAALHKTNNLNSTIADA